MLGGPGLSHTAAAEVTVPYSSWEVLASGRWGHPGSKGSGGKGSELGVTSAG